MSITILFLLPSPWWLRWQLGLLHNQQTLAAWSARYRHWMGDVHLYSSVTEGQTLENLYACPRARAAVRWKKLFQQTISILKIWNQKARNFFWSRCNRREPLCFRRSPFFKQARLKLNLLFNQLFCSFWLPSKLKQGFTTVLHTHASIPAGRLNSVKDDLIMGLSFTNNRGIRSLCC